MKLIELKHNKVNKSYRRKKTHSGYCVVCDNHYVTYSNNTNICSDTDCKLKRNLMVIHARTNFKTIYRNRSEYSKSHRERVRSKLMIAAKTSLISQFNHLALICDPILKQCYKSNTPITFIPKYRRDNNLNENQFYTYRKNSKPILVFQNGVVDNRPFCTKCSKLHQGKSLWCKECKAEAKAKYRKSDGYQVSNNRRARKKNLNRDGSITRKAVSVMMTNQFDLCNICDEDISKDKHIDHIKPLAKDGSHVIANIQLLCPSCNLAKSDSWDGVSGC